MNDPNTASYFDRFLDSCKESACRIKHAVTDQDEEPWKFAA